MATTKQIKESLINQLKNKGANIEVFLSLIDDYIWYWTQEKEMQKDIKINKRAYKAYSASGKEYDKENPSVKNALMYNKQKLAILKELDLNTKNIVNDDNDEL